MNKRAFLISDLHLGHENIIEYCRPEFTSLDDMHNCIISRWNATVKPEDKVYILGDVVFGRKNLQLLNELKGNKILIMGNHDINISARTLLDYFNKIRGCHVLHAEGFGNVVLTHIPVHEGQFHRFKLNIHGHLHTVKLKDPRYINVSCEQVNYTPKFFDTIIEEYVDQYGKGEADEIYFK